MLVNNFGSKDKRWGVIDLRVDSASAAGEVPCREAQGRGPPPPEEGSCRRASHSLSSRHRTFDLEFPGPVYRDADVLWASQQGAQYVGECLIAADEDGLFALFGSLQPSEDGSFPIVKTRLPNPLAYDAPPAPDAQRLDLESAPGGHTACLAGWEKGDVFSPFSRLLISSHVVTRFHS